MIRGEKEKRRRTWVEFLVNNSIVLNSIKLYSINIK
jgi:hypothetical protein